MHLKGKKELQILLLKEGCSVDELCEKTGISRGTIYRVMNGQRVRGQIAKKVCDAYGIEMMDYFELSPKKDSE